jgi:hypothetical protein
MNTLTTYDFEEKTNSSIEYIFLDILDHADSYLTTSFHPVLDNFLKTLNDLEIPLENIKLLDKNELESYYKNIRRLNSFFEKMHDRFQNKQYFGDSELKNQFMTISKSLNTIEITCFKYLMKDAPIEKTQEYIKDGLAKLSQESIARKISF